MQIYKRPKKKKFKIAIPFRITVLKMFKISRKIKNMNTTKRKATKQFAITALKVRVKGQGQLEM